MPIVEVVMSYEQIKARKEKAEQDVIDIQNLIDKQEELQAELDKWTALEKEYRPEEAVDPMEGLPDDTQET